MVLEFIYHSSHSLIYPMKPFLIYSQIVKIRIPIQTSRNEISVILKITILLIQKIQYSS